jgi:hypothetical protein
MTMEALLQEKTSCSDAEGSTKWADTAEWSEATRRRAVVATATRTVCGDHDDAHDPDDLSAERAEVDGDENGDSGVEVQVEVMEANSSHCRRHDPVEVSRAKVSQIAKINPWTDRRALFEKEKLQSKC